jgi:hypothetical protein
MHRSASPRQHAAQVTGAAVTLEAHNEDINLVNRDVFRWSWMWSSIAGWFGIEAE